MALTKVTGAGLGLITGDIATSTAGINNFKAGASAGLGIVSGGNYNVAVGDGAGRFLTTGDKSTFVGFDAGKGITGTPITGSDNTAVGTNAGLLLQGVAAQNTLIGSNAGDAITTGADNTAVGFQALTQTNTGHSNVAMGTNACNGNSTGLRNTGIGFQALANGLTANDNTSLGHNAGVNLTTGHSSVAIGSSALLTENTGRKNVAIGFEALKTQDADVDNNNTAVGYNAGRLTSTGIDNTFVGNLAGDNNSTGLANTFMGSRAGQFNTTGDVNTFIGSGAGIGVTGAKLTGNNTTAVGQGAGQKLQGAAHSNTIFGRDAGAAVSTGLKNTLVGCDSGKTITTGQLNTYVGFQNTISAIDVDHEIAIGSLISGAGTNTVRIGTTNGFIQIALNQSTTSWSAGSDERLKKDIQTSTAGLSFINDLRPVTYKWNAKNAIANSLPQYDASSSDPIWGGGETIHGFVAQEVKTVLDAHSEVSDTNGLWSQDPNGTQQIAYGELVPMLTKAVQELSTALDAALARIATLEG